MHQPESDNSVQSQVMKSRQNEGELKGKTAFLFDLDGTLVDSVYQHVLAWREALEKADIELSV